jgi:SecD/SecF fusion protein
VGLFVGTYSSIFVASPIVYWWSRLSGRSIRKEILETEKAAAKVA